MSAKLSFPINTSEYESIVAEVQTLFPQENPHIVIQKIGKNCTSKEVLLERIRSCKIRDKDLQWFVSKKKELNVIMNKMFPLDKRREFEELFALPEGELQSRVPKIIALRQYVAKLSNNLPKLINNCIENLDDYIKQPLLNENSNDLTKKVNDSVRSFVNAMEKDATITSFQRSILHLSNTYLTTNSQENALVLFLALLQLAENENYKITKESSKHPDTYRIEMAFPCNILDPLK